MLEKIRNPILNTQIIFYLTVVYVSLIPFHFWRGKDGTITLLIFLLWSINRDLKKNIKNFFQNSIALIFISFIALLYLSLLWSSNTELGLYRLEYFKYYFLILIPLVTILNKSNVHILLNSYFIGIFFYSIVSIAIYFGLFEIIGSSITNPKPWLEYVVFSSLLGFAALLSFLYMLHTVNIRFKLLYLLLTIVFIFVLFVNNSRNAQLAFIITVIYGIVRYYKFSWKTLVVAPFIMVITFMLLSHFNIKFIKKFEHGYTELRVQGIEGNIIGIRLAGWLCSYDVLRESPYYGHGMGGHEDRLHSLTRVEHPEKYGNLQRMDWYHNQYAEFYTTTGLLGFSLFIVFLYRFFRLKIRDKVVKIASQSFMLFSLLVFIFEPILYAREFAIFFALFIGIFIASESRNS